MPTPYPLLTDYHTHTPLCHHAEGWPVEYARAAAGLGLAEIGFADHSPMPPALEPFDDWRMSLADLPRYFDAVEAAREEMTRAASASAREASAMPLAANTPASTPTGGTPRPPLPVRLGLEVDYIPGHEVWIEELAGRAEWDYLIGSVHYIAPGWDVDSPYKLARFDEQPLEAIWAAYLARLEACVRSGLFDFIGHPDLPKKFGHRLADGDRPRDMRPLYEPVIAALAETGTAFEINTAGLRKPAGECYPALPFLQMASAAGVPALINSDAHAPGEVGAGFAEALALARQAGYTELVRFEKRQRRSVGI